MSNKYPYVYEPGDAAVFNKNNLFSMGIGEYAIRIVGGKDRWNCYLCEFIDEVDASDPVWDCITNDTQFRIHQSYLLPAPEFDFKQVELIGADALF